MIRIGFQCNDGKCHYFTVNEIAKQFGFLTTGYMVHAEVCPDDSNQYLKATLLDTDYPAIDVDAQIGKTTYLATSVELPNEGSENVVARVYSGNSNLEDGEPLVMVPLGDREEGDESRRVVLVDTRIGYTESVEYGRLAKLPLLDLGNFTTENSVDAFFAKKEAD